MAEPKKKSTRSRRGKRQAKNQYQGINLTSCPKCGSKIMPHHVCNVCGFYGGKKIIDLGTPQKKVTTKVTKK